MSSYSIQKILVPVDLSETSLNALDTAVSIAVKQNATLLLLNVLETVHGSFPDEPGYSTFNNLFNTSDVLTALISAIQHSHNIKPEIFQEKGNVTDTIIKTSLAQQCDLIVMGTHGASGFRDGFIGSNTYNTIKYATCPVLSVPPRK